METIGLLFPKTMETAANNDNDKSGDFCGIARRAGDEAAVAQWLRASKIFRQIC